MKKSFHFRVKSAGEICLNNKLSYGNHSSLTINTKKMKTFELKSLNGKWYQGQLVIRYNLLNVLRVLILAALAAVALAILYWIVKGLIWCFVQLTPAFVWIGDNWWWLLLSLLGIVGLVWAWMYGLFRNLFKRRPKMNRPQHEGKRKLWPWLLLLALVLGIVLCWKSCSGDDKKSAAVENVQAVVYDKSFDKVIIARAYLDGVQKEVLSGCPRALVGFKFINDKPVSEYDFKGLTYDESVKIVAEDWKPLVVENLNPALELSEQQMAVITLAAMRMGKYGFARSTFLQKVNEGNFAEAANWLLLQKADGEIRKTKDEPKQYFYVLRALWTGKIDIDELIDMPMFSYKAVPAQKMYDKNGGFVWNEEIGQILENGSFATPREALELK